MIHEAHLYEQEGSVQGSGHCAAIIITVVVIWNTAGGHVRGAQLQSAHGGLSLVVGERGENSLTGHQSNDENSRYKRDMGSESYKHIASTRDLAEIVKVRLPDVEITFEPNLEIQHILYQTLRPTNDQKGQTEWGWSPEDDQEGNVDDFLKELQSDPKKYS